MFVFGYGRGNRPPPFNFCRPRPQRPGSGGETNAERTAREARKREEKAEARERMWQENQEKKVCINSRESVEGGAKVIAAGETNRHRARTRRESQRTPGRGGRY